jgi:hypothetical protein
VYLLKNERQPSDPPHSCDPPRAYSFDTEVAPGDIWKCEDCGVVWLALSAGELLEWRVMRWYHRWAQKLVKELE